jgi:hypothetical protein
MERINSFFHHGKADRFSARRMFSLPCSLTLLILLDIVALSTYGRTPSFKITISFSLQYFLATNNVL